MRCANCGTRIGGQPFQYGDWSFCCECMSSLCSWFLDGGFTGEPEMFRWVTEPRTRPDPGDPE